MKLPQREMQKEGVRLQPELELSDYRRRVNDLYASVRSFTGGTQQAWELWRAGRDDLFRHHAQSALTPAQRRGFSGLAYYEYDPSLRLAVEVDGVPDREVLDVPLEVDGLMQMARIGRVEVEIDGGAARLSLFWILGYGGGLFLPFRDATNDGETFGGGRYLLDAVKGADLGWQAGKLVLDFNFAYNPSCAYSPQWHCPLPPAENWLKVSVRAGEKAFPGGSHNSQD